MKYSLPSLKSLCASSMFASTGELSLWGFGSLGELAFASACSGMELLEAARLCFSLCSILQTLCGALMAEMLCPEV